MKFDQSAPELAKRKDREKIFTLDWYRTLSRQGRYAFWASFMGWALDAFDTQMFSFILVAVAATFLLTNAQAGLISTVSLVASALGGILAGTLADSIGRVRTLMLTVGVYAFFTFLSGFSPSYEILLVCRTLQGLGFGGEWAAGAVIVAEVADPAQRGRVLGMIQSSWAIGWAVVLGVSTLVLSLFNSDIAWRIVFWLGILPALLILYVRRLVKEPEVYVETRKAEQEQQTGTVEKRSFAYPFLQLFKRDLLRTTVLTSLLALGAQGGYYAIFTWLPTFLKQSRHLSVVGSAPYVLVVIVGSFLGYVVSGYVNDWLGRRITFIIYAVCSALLIVLYTQIPVGANVVLLLLGVPLGFFASGIFSGFGSYLAELYPSRVRGAGQGFAYNIGRGLGAFFPTIIGVLSLTIGLAGAIGFGALGYGVCVLSLLFLPETRGKEFVALD
jgi:MFS family permease